MKTLFFPSYCNLPFLPLQIFDTIKYIIPNLSNLSITSKDKTLSTTTRSTKVKNSNIRWNKFSHHRSNYHLKKRRKTLVVISRRERASLGRLFGGREGARGSVQGNGLPVVRGTRHCSSVAVHQFRGEYSKPSRVGPRGPSFLPSFQASVSPSRARAANVSRPVIDTYIKRE